MCNRVPLHQGRVHEFLKRREHELLKLDVACQLSQIDDMGWLTPTAARGQIAIVGAAIFQSLRRFDWLMPQAKAAQFPWPATSDPKALHSYKPFECHRREISLSWSRSRRGLPTFPVRQP